MLLQSVSAASEVVGENGVWRCEMWRYVQRGRTLPAMVWMACFDLSHDGMGSPLISVTLQFFAQVKKLRFKEGDLVHFYRQ